MNKAIELLKELVVQVDEDCPNEYRTRHLRDCMSEVYEFIKEYDKEIEKS
tara:strand:+ start:439 stop:588 length:150 start_codon:yes stop_codon:yes gene_type:complete